MAKDKAEKQPTQERELKVVETLRGTFHKFEAEGEIIAGILTHKAGRQVGKAEDDTLTDTIEIFDPVTGKLVIVAAHTALKSRIDHCKDRFDGQVFVEIAYLGKKAVEKDRDKPEKDQKKYHNYQVKAGEATQDELLSLRDYEEAQKA